MIAAKSHRGRPAAQHANATPLGATAWIVGGIAAAIAFSWLAPFSVVAAVAPILRVAGMIFAGAALAVIVLAVLAWAVTDADVDNRRSPRPRD